MHKTVKNCLTNCVALSHCFGNKKGTRSLKFMRFKLMRISQMGFGFVLFETLGWQTIFGVSLHRNGVSFNDVHD